MDDNVRALPTAPPSVDEGVNPPQEFSLEEVGHLHDVLNEQNASLLQRLGMLGLQLTQLDMLTMSFNVLLDFTMGDKDQEARKQYEVAVAMQLNNFLKQAYARKAGIG